MVDTFLLDRNTVSIAETYFHWRNTEFSLAQAERLISVFQEVVPNKVQRIYDQHVQVQISVGSGSTKAWITIAAPLAIFTILNYNTIKENINELYEDAKAIGELIIEGFFHGDQPPISVDFDKKAIITQRRSAEIGKIKRILDRINNFEIQKDQKIDKKNAKDMYEIENYVNNIINSTDGSGKLLEIALKNNENYKFIYSNKDKISEMYSSNIDGFLPNEVDEDFIKTYGPSYSYTEPSARMFQSAALQFLPEPISEHAGVFRKDGIVAKRIDVQ